MKKQAFLLVLLLSAVTSIQVFGQSFTFTPVNDAGNGGDSVIKMVTAKETIGGKEYDVNTITGKVTTKFQYGFVVLTADPDAPMLAALKTAKGFKFKTSGDGQVYQVRVETSDVTDYDFYGKSFVAPKGNPVEISLTYASLAQLGWGAKKPFNPANITKISVQTIGQPIASISYKFFDLQPVK